MGEIVGDSKKDTGMIRSGFSLNGAASMENRILIPVLHGHSLFLGKFSNWVSFESFLMGRIELILV